MNIYNVIIGHLGRIVLVAVACMFLFFWIKSYVKEKSIFNKLSIDAHLSRKFSEIYIVYLKVLDRVGETGLYRIFFWRIYFTKKYTKLSSFCYQRMRYEFDHIHSLAVGSGYHCFSYFSIYKQWSDVVSEIYSANILKNRTAYVLKSIYKHGYDELQHFNDDIALKMSELYQKEFIFIMKNKNLFELDVFFRKYDNYAFNGGPGIMIAFTATMHYLLSAYSKNIKHKLIGQIATVKEKSTDPRMQLEKYNELAQLQIINKNADENNPQSSFALVMKERDGVIQTILKGNPGLDEYHQLVSQLHDPQLKEHYKSNITPIVTT